MTNSNESARTDGRWTQLAGVARDALLLVRQEWQLAQAETIEKVTPAARSTGMVVAGGLLAALGSSYLMEAFVRLLATRLPPWMASLLFGAGLMAGGVALVERGRRDLQDIDLAPHKTINSLREDKAWLLDQIRSKLI